MQVAVDCSGVPYPVLAQGKVTLCGTVESARPEGSVYRLKLVINGKSGVMPEPGQFYMLRSEKSGVLLARPISLYHAEKTHRGVSLEFLILLKGNGTKELCSLEVDDGVQILGPLGNTFPKPQPNTKVCIIGGGVGVAPVAGFAETLQPDSYDFYAAFKSGSYGLDRIKPLNLVIATDDGSVGTKGMLPVIISEAKLRLEQYSAVYACGPSPMLAYVKSIAEKAGIPCWISMEAHMACGVGVCLGCTIATTEGNKRCCKEGPVFDASILQFEKPKVSPAVIEAQKNVPLKKNPDLSVSVAGVTLRNPLIGASGTFGFGTEYASIMDVSVLGGIASKGLTLEPRPGNTGIRIWETPSGLMNSIGLQNPGIPHFIEHELPQMLALKPVAIANLSGSTIDTYIDGAKLLDQTKVPLIELNISCPNVKAGGAAWGMTCDGAASVVKEVRAVTNKPLIVKLTPQASDVVGVALACIEAGADAISLSNSFQGVVIDIERGVPVFDNIKAGFGGPAVRPMAVRLVYDLYTALQTLPVEKQKPIVGIGGISTWQDAIEFIMAGATALEVGTATFMHPLTMKRVIEGIAAFMKRKGFTNINQMCGIAHCI
ncbi:MAG: dihydroorotate dehydrogenase [Treponema sp.]|nr:dihydroorotate dehydrogenase [Treponema sp.]